MVMSKELHERVKDVVLKELEVATPGTQSVDLSEMGISGLRRTQGYVRQEFLPQLIWPRAAKIYQEMTYNDPIVGSILYTCEQLIKRISWKVEPRGNSRVDQEAKEFLESCIHDMSYAWSDVIDEILTMMSYGFAWHEEVYKTREGYNRDPRRNSKYADGRIGWRKIAGRAQQSIEEWVFDDDGGILAAIQRAESDLKTRVLPLEKSVLFRTKFRYDNPEGYSLLRNAYRPWYFKKHIEEIEGIGIERDLAGLPVLQTPEGVDIWNPADKNAGKLKANAETLVCNIRRDENEGVVLPHGWDLSLLSTGGRRQIDTNAIISRYDQRIAVTLMADIIMMGSEGIGSFALAGVKRGMLGAALDALTHSVADVLNQHSVPRLFRLNAFPGITGYPKIVPGEVVTPNLNELARLIQALAGAKMPLFPDENLEEYLREIVGMPSLEALTPQQRREQLEQMEEREDRGGGPNLAIRTDDQRQQNVGLPSDAR